MRDETDDLQTVTLADLADGVPSVLANIEYQTFLNTPQPTIRAQIAHNIARGLPEMRSSSQRGEHDQTVSLCGSAPSLLTTLAELTGKVMACNGAIPALIKAGIKIDYAMIWDASPEMVKYVMEVPGCEWMVASRVHPEVIDRLLALGQRVTLWHADADGADDILGEGRMLIDGGAQAVTRGAFLVAYMGFTDLHVFGADSSYHDDTHIGGSVRDEKEVLMTVEGTHRVWRTTVWMMSQSDDWQKIILPCLVANKIRVSVHGEGLLPFVHRLWMDRNHPDGAEAA